MYDETNVATTVAKIMAVIERCKQPDAPCSANPEACKYCRAQGICPELHREVELVVRDKCELTPAIRAKRREFLSLVESWAERVKEDDRQFCLNGGEIPGWELRTKHGPRFIPDPYTAFLRLREHFGPEEIMGVVEMKIGKIEETALKHQGWGETQKERIAFINTVLGETVERKPDCVTLVRSRTKE